jgi:hypothetical protein
MENSNNIKDFYIYIDNENIPKEKCEMIINKFNNDERKYKGITTLGENEFKITNEINITNLEDWKEIDNYLYQNLSVAFGKYSEKVIKNKKGEIITSLLGNSINISHSIGRTIDFGYQIQWYKANTGHYDWHTDNITSDNQFWNQNRIVTFIWYLNNVEVGGETDFLNGKIKPTAGKLVIFPSTWTYLHRGKMPISNDKYIITGWLGNRIFKEDGTLIQ